MRARRGRVFLAFLMPVFFVFFWINPLAALELSALRYSVQEGGARVVLDLTGSAEFSQNRLKEPERFYVDIKGTVLRAAVEKEYRPGGGLIDKIRLSQYDLQTVRVVFDVEGSANVQITRLAAPERLVLDFTPGGASGGALIETAGEGAKPKGDAVRQAAGARAELASYIIKNQKPGFPEATTKPPAGSDTGGDPKWRILIDAGHGGHDPGAISRHGLMEKDITLQIAHELARILRADPAFDVRLTRDKDVYLSLEDRTLIANRFGADLFVSIHANSSPRAAARGIETYFLNWTDDEEANRVAARENHITVRRMNEARSELGSILASLELQGKRDESLKLANYVQRDLIGKLEHPKEMDLGVKQALFYVLVGASMPSVLVEVSFLSNEKDERLLREPDYLKSAAHGIASGIESYLKETPAQNVAKR